MFRIGFGRWIYILVCMCFSHELLAQQVFKTTPKSVIGYLEYLPDGYKSSSKDYPVVIFLHGVGERGPASNDPKKLAEGADLLAKIGPPMYVKRGVKFPFILITPQLKSNYYGWSNWYVMEVIEHVRKTLRIDKNRIYLTGLSMGGFGAWNLAQDYPGYFAAVAPLCAGGNLSKAKGIADAGLPVWTFHGDRDDVVPVSRSINMVNAINNHGANPKAMVSVYKGVKHNAWDRAYRPDHAFHKPNVYEWMMAQSKGRSQTPANKAPIANAGPDRSVDSNVKSLVLNGSGRDEDGSIKSFLWTKVSGGNVKLTNEKTKDLTISHFSAGVYKFRLTVTDNQGATHADETTVTVNSAAKSPVVSAGENKTIQLPASTATLTGSAKVDDDKITSYRWTKTQGGEVKMEGETTAVLKVSNLKEGVYRFRLTAKSGSGVEAYDETTVTVKAEIISVPVVSAGGNRRVELPVSEVVLNGKASVENGSIKSYEWRQRSGGKVSMIDAKTANLKLKDLREGKYAFRLTVESDKGKSAYDDVEVIVQDAKSKTPLVDAGKDVVVTLPEEKIQFEGKASVESGKIKSYRWKQVSGAALTLHGENTSRLTVKDLREGDFAFRLSAFTEEDVEGSDEVRLKVRKATASSELQVSAGGDKRVQLPVTEVAIKGAAIGSDEEDVVFQWKQVDGPSSTMRAGNSSTLIVKDLKPGSYAFKLTATNGEASASDMMTLTVEAQPHDTKPVAEAGQNVEVQLPVDEVTFEGNGTSDNGQIVLYQWLQVSGAELTLHNAATKRLTVSDIKEAGVYTFRLVIKDQQGNTAYDDVSLVAADPLDEDPDDPDADPVSEFADGSPFELRPGAEVHLQRFSVVVYDPSGKVRFNGRWSDDSFEEVFSESGLYVYHILHGRIRLKIGKIMIQ